jgi:hypothetical protein
MQSTLPTVYSSNVLARAGGVQEPLLPSESKLAGGQSFRATDARDADAVRNYNTEPLASYRVDDDTDVETLWSLADLERLVACFDIR